MRQEQAAALGVVAVEPGPCPRPHHLEEHGGRVLPDEHRAQPVMQILRQQPFGVELGGHQPALWYEIVAKVNPSGRSVITLSVQPHIVISVIARVGL